MSVWRAEHDGLIYGHAATREIAQEFVEGLPFATVTEKETGERWLRHNDGVWAESVPVDAVRRLTDPKPETWPHLPERKDIDG